MSITSQAQRSHLGTYGEDLAAAFLSRKGYRIVTRNFRARYGEVDIIALDHETLVFIEVKTRTGTQYGTPEEAITPRKLREVIQTAQYYVTLHPELPKLLRIDVIGILLNTDNAVVSMRHTPNVSM